MNDIKKAVHSLDTVTLEKSNINYILSSNYEKSRLG